MASSPLTNDLDILVQVSELFTSQDTNTVLNRLVNLAVQAVHATGGSLIVYENGGVSRSYLANPKNAEENNAMPANLVSQITDDGLAGWVAANEEVALVEDTREDARWAWLPDDAHQALSALSLPILYQNRLLAVMTLVHEQTNYFTKHHLQLLTIITNQAAIAIQNLQTFNQMQASQHQLEIIVQTIPDVLFVLDHEGYVILLNQPAVRLVDAEDRLQVVGIHFDRLVGRAPVLTQVQAFIKETQANGAHHAEPLTFDVRSDKHKRDFNVTVSMWQDEWQARYGYMVMMHDISQLRDLHRFKDEMLRLASHDLCSPLALITGYADMIAIDTPDMSSPVHDHIEVIQRTATRMNNLLEELLRIEQIRSSPLELHESIDVEKLVRIVLVNGRPAADRKGLALEGVFNFRGTPNIFADPVLIRQAMENLVSNAIKYTPPGGRITLTADDAEGRFNFVVEDTGVGIAPENLPYVFEAFYRINSAQTEDTQGAGLGLSLVHDVIERHGGQVWVDSIVGQGSRFGFWIPLEGD